MLKIISIAAAAAVLSGCAGFSSLTAPGAAGTANAKQVVDNLNAFNEALKNGPCNGWGNLDWNPPLPPTGGLHALCQFGNPNVGKGGLVAGPAPTSAADRAGLDGSVTSGAPSALTPR